MYHVHVVDSNGNARVNAAVVFAHLTLRCGHLRHAVVVSASSARDLATGAATATTNDAQREVLREGVDGAHDDREVQLVKAMEEAVRYGCSSTSTSSSTSTTTAEHDTVDAVVSLPYVASAPHAIARYAHLDTPFTAAEQSLACACASRCVRGAAARPRYFDLILAVDAVAYDAVLQYYLTHMTATTATATATADATSATRAAAHDDEEDEAVAAAVRYTRHTRGAVGVAHVVCDDVTRVGALYQRLVEALLGVDNAHAAKRGGGGDGDASRAVRRACPPHAEDVGACPPWVAAADDVVASFAQVLGVDVLVTMV